MQDQAHPLNKPFTHSVRPPHHPFVPSSSAPAGYDLQGAEGDLLMSMTPSALNALGP